MKIEKLDTDIANEWARKLGHLRPWEVQFAQNEAKKADGDTLKLLLHHGINCIERRFSSGITPDQLEDILLIAADISTIFKGIEGVKEALKTENTHNLAWQLVLEALRGKTYRELLQQIKPAHEVDTTEYKDTRLDKRRTTIGTIKQDHPTSHKQTKSVATDATAFVVATYVKHNSITKSEVPLLVANIRRAFTDVEHSTPPATTSDQIISIEKSLATHFLVSRKDARKFRSLKRHIKAKFNMTLEEYEEKFGLPENYRTLARDAKTGKFSQIRQGTRKRTPRTQTQG